MSGTEFFPKLQTYVETRVSEMKDIPRERRSALEQLAFYISGKRKNERKVELVFICTHNSRRSHFAQIWAETACRYFGIDEVISFSGGTEATAFSQRAVAAIERAGFSVSHPEGENPHYMILFSADAKPMECFSKTYDDPFNPRKGFSAIMTCSNADENCPNIPGVEFRIGITYEDPKIADGSSEERQVYDARCAQIATEMFYLFSKVAT